MIGTGYVGLVTAAGFAELGSEVWCVDIDAAKIERLRRGEVPIYEPGLEELLASNAERLHFSTELGDALEHARLLFVAVGTPPTYSGDADLSAVHAVVDAIPAVGRPRAGDEVDGALRHRRGAPARVRRAGQGRARATSPAPSSSRRARRSRTSCTPTASSWATTATGRATPSSSSTRRSNAPLVRTDIASAEMVKLASNAFLATKISFINEIANVCEETGADVVEVARGMGLDERIGPKFLQAGIGFGGSCFPKDVDALKQLAGNSGYHFQLLTAVIEVNELQKRRVIGKLQKHLGGLVGKRVALLGLAFKPNTDDMREASSLVLSARLKPTARASPPTTRSPRSRRARCQRRQLRRLRARRASRDADAVVLVTEWPEFARARLAAGRRGDGGQRS